MKCEEKTVMLKIPKKTTKRYKRKRGSSTIFLFDFRGIRTGGGVQKSKRSYRGMKPTLTSVEHTKKLCKEYFESCYKPLFDKNGELRRDANGDVIKIQVRPFSITGLALKLGMDNDTLLRWCAGVFDDFSEEDELYLISTVLKQAKQRIEQYAEERLYDREGFNGARFNLDTNFGWKTQKEAAEIEKMRFEQWRAKQELELKKQMMAANDDENNNTTVNIVRKTADD